MESKHYEISAIVTIDRDLTENALIALLMSSGDVEMIERVSIRELET